MQTAFIRCISFSVVFVHASDMLIKQHIAEILKLRLEALYSASASLEDVEELSAEEPAGEEQPELLQY